MNVSYIKEYIDKDAVIVEDGMFNNLGILGSKPCANILYYMDDSSFAGKLKSGADKICLICNDSVYSSIVNNHDIFFCIVSEPKKVFYYLHNHLVEKTDFYRKLSGKKVHPTCKIDNSAVIYDGVEIGERVTIDANVTIYGNVIIEDNVIIRAGSVIGSEGFQFLNKGDEIIGIKHAGRVRICRNVEIQSNCCIDKAVFNDETVIGEYTKLDNLVHIAHNVKIGKRCMIAANANLGGYVTVGDDVWLGPSVTVSNRLTVGSNAKICIGSVVIRNVSQYQKTFGNPAMIINENGMEEV